MKCRIDKRGKQVFTPQNERSKLFDKLHNITGDFQKALDVFGITETNGFKEFKNRLRPISKLNSTDPIVFQSVLERLQQSGLSDNIFQLNTKQLNQKLIELGVSAEVRNQIQALQGSPNSFDRLLNLGLIEEVEC